MKTLTFYKEWNGRWYADIKAYPGPKADLEMVCGADTMLDILSQGEEKVTLSLSTTEISGWDKLELLTLGNPEGPELGTGAWYKMKSFKGISYDLEMWLCGVTK